MKRFLSFSVAVLFCTIFCFGTHLGAQQIHVTSPMQRHGDSFSESIGTNWGLSGKNWFLDVGGRQANNLPRYGHHDMNSDLRGGFQFQRGGVSGYFNGWAGQGYNAYNTMEAPSVTFMNGQHAYFQHVTDTPFVVSTIPVVGSWQNGQYQPHYDPEVTLTPSVLQQKIDRLKQQEQKPRYVRETPNAPALKEVEPPVKKKKSRTASMSGSRESYGSQKKSESGKSSYSRTANPNTAETPALSVSEMRKRYRAAQEND
ncbi:MAG: hypothetical protein Q4C70_10795 [Planctomycetia bacterium]|nr:hypothetical protein [Planctomycetia bacterium]